MKVGNGRHRHAGRINIRVAKHRVQRRRTAATPSPDSDPAWIYERPLCDRTCGRSLVSGIHDSSLAIKYFSPCAATRRWCATIVDTHHDVSLLCEHAVPQSGSAHPDVERSLSPRFGVSVKQHRITLLRIEIGRLHHPSVELHAVADVDLEELGRRRF